MEDARAIAIIRQAIPAVVSIAISKHLEDLEKEIPKELYPAVPGASGSQSGNHPQIPKAMADHNGMVQVGGGTGFIVESDGIILTNKHVINDLKAEYTVVLNDGRTFRAKVMSSDPINDVAIITIDAGEALPCLGLGDASKLQLGQSLIAIGNALGVFPNTVSRGIVSGLSRSISAQADPDAPAQEMRGLIQTDAAINPGNSGGPIVDDNGLVVGINAAIVSGAQSIGFAIPINAARRDLNDIKKFGRIRRPLLGIRYVMIDSILREKMKLPVDYGALVLRESQHDYAVVPGSPADTAGIKEKDIVLSFNGARLDGNHPIQDFLEDLDVDDEVELIVLRAGKEITIKLKLAERN